MRIAIVGAGFSGCLLYSNFKKLNYDVKIFEKSRGAGGRCSTRYIGDKKIDHGTPYFKPISNDFKEFCDKYENENILKKIEDFYYPTDGMNKICSALINENDFYRNTRIERLFKKDEKWYLKDDGDEVYEKFDEVFITIPATQVFELDMKFPTYLRELFSNIKYESVASMLVYGDKLHNIKLDDTLDEDYFRKIIDNSQKYNYDDFLSYVFHSSKNVSKSVSSKEDVKNLILENINKKLHKKIEEDFYTIPHFWKYGFVSKGLESNFLYDKNLNLGFCGDYFGGKNLQSAYDSSMKIFKYLKKIWLKDTFL